MLSQEEFKNLARLARLDPEDSSLEDLLDDFNKILDYVEKINEIHSAETAEYYTAIDVHNVMREDSGAGVLSGAEISENAPEWEAGHIVVPRVIETE